MMKKHFISTAESEDKMKEKELVDAAKKLKKYCKSMPINCDGCYFYEKYNCCPLVSDAPAYWEIEDGAT